MLTDPHIEDLIPKCENRYALSRLLAKRTRQLVDGAQPLSERRSPNCLTQASMEVQEGKLTLVRGKHEYVVPLRPEVEAAKLARERLALEKEQEAIIEEAKLADNKTTSLEERVARERKKAADLQDKTAREFTSQLLEIIERHHDEAEADEEATAANEKEEEND